MDFFQAQSTAHRKSKLLVFYFTCAVVMIIAVVYLVALFASQALQQRSGYQVPLQLWQPDLLLYAAGGTLAIIAAGSFFKTLSLHSGGSVVARSVGGVKISPDTTDPKQRRLLNIVEEMAIASGVRVPEVYLLPEKGINAFAAGYSADDAAVAVTEGAIDVLSRDELQGVIAHEFSHILNGDMRLNIRLIGLLFGILLLALVGRGLVHSLRFAGVSSRRNKNSGGVVMVMLLVGLALIVVGYVGVFFGRLIQAAVSRQREFLADASAVQFTRNPDGIGGALKKIGGLATGSKIANAHATETSHLFFANALSGTAVNLFATHPPLVQRIRAIDPSFDGKFVAVRPPSAKPPPVRPGPSARKGPPPLRAEQFIRSVAALGVADAAAQGAALIQSIPPALREAARTPGHARAAVLTLLANGGEGPAAARQRDTVARLFSTEQQAVFAELLSQAAHLPASARLALTDLALPTIRILPPEEIDAFLAAVQQFIDADNQTTLFEFSLQQVVSRYLKPAISAGKKPGTQILSFQPLVEPIATVLTMLAHAGSSDPAQIQRAFNAGAAQLGLIRDRLALQSASTLAPGRLRQSLAQLDRASLPIKRQLLRAMAQTASADGVIMPAEAEVLRAVSAAIDCPAPPLQATLG